MGAVSDLVDRLVGLSLRRHPPEALGGPVALPDVDADENTLDAAGDGDRSAAPLLILEYRDAKGNFSRRRVTVLSVEVGMEGDYLRAFCHERNALRSFRIDRIVAVIDPVTGEYLSQSAFSSVLADFGAGVKDWSPPTAQQQAFSACRSGVLVLMLVAWADGRFHSGERDVIADFIAETCQNIRGYDPAPILDWAARQYPVPDKVVRVLARMVETDRTGDQMTRLLAAAVRLAEADGEVVDEEEVVVRGIKFARRMTLLDLGYDRVEDFTSGWSFGVSLPAFCEALDISYDQRVTRKKVTYVWARGNPADHRFRIGDMVHSPAGGGPGCITLQVSDVKEPAVLAGMQQVSFRIYKTTDLGITEIGKGDLPASEFELVLRDGPARLGPFMRDA